MLPAQETVPDSLRDHGFVIAIDTRGLSPTQIKKIKRHLLAVEAENHIDQVLAGQRAIWVQFDDERSIIDPLQDGRGEGLHEDLCALLDSILAQEVANKTRNGSKSDHSNLRP
jgi:siroheme synthase (precorrin-2 oxidase/ferrochelatase)